MLLIFFSVPATYTVSEPENLAVGQTIITVTATDGDSSTTPDGVITYAFVSPQSHFTISARSGVILLSSSLDRDTMASPTVYALPVTASDGSTTVTATVTVTVTDVNDNSPVFSAALYT